ncbi:MAG: hypothetical protein BAJATHORv1_90001 [Candidatus Thorarchaeota archaeon]|nr:MAG: hypothetical protein BAJATHORv1_90001 [Candidatus Thorarchaeota archaeon]
MPAEAKTFKDGLELITYAKEQAQGLIDAGVSTQIISELVLKQAAGHIQFDAIIEVVAPGYGTIIYTHGPNGITRWNSQGKMIRNTDATGIIPMDQQAWSNGAPQGLTRVNVYDVQPDGTFLASHHILDSALGSAILSSVSSSDLKVNLNDYCRRNSIGGAEKERLVSIRELIDATFVEGSSKFCYDILVAAVLNSPVEHHHLGPTQCSGDIK